MRKIIFTLMLSLLLVSFTDASAQMMYGGVLPSGAVVADQTQYAGELAGQEIAQKLQTKTVICADLSRDDYESLGDYYMGLMMGSSHDSMEQYIEKSYGADYLKSMHIAMGERFSGCKVNVSFPAGMMGFGPMMSNWGPSGFHSRISDWQWRDYSMMGWGFPGMMSGYGIGGAIFMTFVWILAIVGTFAVIKFIISINSSRK